MMDIIEVPIFTWSASPPFILGFFQQSRSAAAERYMAVSKSGASSLSCQPDLSCFVCLLLVVAQAQSFATSHQKEYLQSETQRGGREQKRTCVSFAVLPRKQKAGGVLRCCFIVRWWHISHLHHVQNSGHCCFV